MPERHLLQYKAVKQVYAGYIHIDSRGPPLPPVDDPRLATEYGRDPMLPVYSIFCRENHPYKEPGYSRYDQGVHVSKRLLRYFPAVLEKALCYGYGFFLYPEIIRNQPVNACCLSQLKSVNR